MLWRCSFRMGGRESCYGKVLLVSIRGKTSEYHKKKLNPYFVLNLRPFCSVIFFKLVSRCFIF